jgi:hypothetical protein
MNQTRTSRAAQIGVSMNALKSWERCGVDVFDDEQIKSKISKLRNLPPDLKPEWHPRLGGVGVQIQGDDPTTIDIETIIAQLSSATDKHQAQTVKIQIDGLLNAYKLREAAGRYVAKSIVEESLIRIGAVFKSSLLRMEADLPPMLEGMNPSTMRDTIRLKVDEVLRNMEDEYLKVYGESDS